VRELQPLYSIFSPTNCLVKEDFDPRHLLVGAVPLSQPSMRDRGCADVCWVELKAFKSVVEAVEEGKEFLNIPWGD
jgi:hypothetical protein